MSPVTHAQISWLLGNLWELTRRERGMVLLAGLLPDLDGIGILFGLEYYGRYHHLLTHNLATGVVLGALSFAFSRRKWLTALLAFLSFHLHLLGDYVGSGPSWPISYLWPFSDVEWLFPNQWDLASWQNFLITLVALILCFHVARRLGRTPVEFFSLKGDAAVVEAIRRRWPR